VFDLFHSSRFETVVDAIEGFAVWVTSHADAGRHSEDLLEVDTDNESSDSG
jgi:hypothetical protein